MSQTQAIVLRKYPFQESDLLVNLFSQAHGKIRCIAKGARRSKRRFPGCLESGRLLQVQMGRSPRGELWMLQEACQICPQIRWRQELKRIAVANYIVELADRFLAEGQKASEKFTLVKEWFEALEKKELDLGDLCHFELKWLGLSGFGPILDRCVDCAQPRGANPSWRFISARGGIACPRCAKGTGIPVPKDWRPKSLQRLLESYIMDLLGRPLRSLKWMHECLEF